MEIITIESELYKEFARKIDFITEFITNSQSNCTENNINDTWVDSYEVCTFLRISERTLQRLRSNGQISYSILSGKTYYKISEIKRMLDEHLIRANEEYLIDLIENHKEYNKIRSKNKPDNKKNSR
jgi:hypothetical protein